MVQNGMSIENEGDIAFLEKSGSEDIKKKIAEWKKTP
jgi:hypothetical protein